MALLSISKSAKDGDEGKPYEFGFTIDGEQHRYEKRDANGIIQGEFGFITADGIYHVTTYATDENGSFRILSMRNVRISDPLDGSGGGHGPKVPASEVQAAGRKAQQVQQATAPAKPQQPVPPTKLQQLQQPAPPTILQQPQQPPTSTIAFVPPTFSNQIIQTTTRRAPLVFTTQPTLKPACASCGYVTYPSTTPKPITQSSAQHIPINKPNEIESFQNGQGQFNQAYSTTPSASLVFGSGPTADSFAQENFKPGDVQRPQVPSGGIPQTQPIPISQNNLAVNVNGHSTSNGQSLPQNIESFGGSPRAFPAVPGGTQTQQFSPSQPQQFSPSQPQQFSPSQPQQFSPSQPVGPIPSQRQPKLSDQFSSDPSPLGPVIPAQQSLNETPSAYVQPPAFSQQQQPQTPDNTNAFNQVPGPAPSLPAINNFAAPQINSQLPAVPQVTDRSRVDDIKVENGMILVPNNAPIKIKDKYPGMVDGLPQGIEENDIKDLLYKFNYTIGFHGHYEKGYKDGSKIGGYFVNGRDGISRVVTYVADAYGYRPKFRLINLGLESTDTPKEDTEKTFGLKNFEFVWYPLN